jgi:DNA-binding FadR family transcriptional regulator
MFNAEPRSGEQRTQIHQRLLRLSGNPVTKRTCCGIHAELSRAEEQVA